MSKTIVLDSYALLAFFQNEKGADKVRDILLEAEAKNRKVLLSLANWGEVYYIISRKLGKPSAEETLRNIDRMAIEIIPLDREMTYVAAQFKSKYSLSYADCFAAALASIKKAELVTGDKEFRLLEKEIQIQWL
jgi:predicted nucleic acid-binding protein